MSPARLLRRLDDQRGVVAVIVALLMVVLGGTAAVTFDLARLRHERHVVQSAVDLGSLAGAGLLPVDTPAAAAIAEATAIEVTMNNAPGLSPADISVSFACVVSDPEGNGGQDSDELRYRCYHDAPGVNWSTGVWTTRGDKSIHDCDPYGGDRCNTIRLTASSTIGYFFAPLIGHQTGNTGALRAASCKGCGPMPIDLVLIVDRTGSMSNTDVANVRRAIANSDAAMNSVLEFYDPNNVHIGLVALPYKNTSNCPVGYSSTQVYPTTSTQHDLWQVSPLSDGDNYRLSGGGLNPSSPLVQRVQCLQRATGTTQYVDDRPSNGNHTNYGDPIRAAQWMLETQGRPDVPNVIVFMGDGEANQPQAYDSRGRVIRGRYNPCSYADQAGDAAKTATGSGFEPTTIFSLGYGVGAPSGGGSGEEPTCAWDWGSPFEGRFATTFFASVASHLLDDTPSTDDGTPSTDSAPGGCAATENTDGDYYFCEERGENLSTVFLQIAQATVTGSRLVNF